MPSVETWNYTRKGTNSTAFRVGKANFFFSYTTCVGFSHDDWPRRVVCHNDWSNTTGRHLNVLDGGDKEAKARRFPRLQFEGALGRFTDWYFRMQRGVYPVPEMPVYREPPTLAEVIVSIDKLVASEK